MWRASIVYVQRIEEGSHLSVQPKGLFVLKLKNALKGQHFFSSVEFSIAMQNWVKNKQETFFMDGTEKIFDHKLRRRHSDMPYTRTGRQRERATVRGKIRYLPTSSRRVSRTTSPMVIDNRPGLYTWIIGRQSVEVGGHCVDLNCNK